MLKYFTTDVSRRKSFREIITGRSANPVEKPTALEIAILNYCRGSRRDALEILNSARPYISEHGSRVIVKRQVLYDTIGKLVKEGKLGRI
jgi:hypothetical protein